jgi:hypothetical protein
MDNLDIKDNRLLIIEGIFPEYSKKARSIALRYIIAAFVISIAIFIWHAVVTGGMSTLDYVIIHPEKKFFINFLDIIFIVFFFASILTYFGYVIMYHRYEYFEKAKIRCIDFLRDNQNISEEEIELKAKNEYDWVDKNIGTTPF